MTIKKRLLIRYRIYRKDATGFIKTPWIFKRRRDALAKLWKILRQERDRRFKLAKGVKRLVRANKANDSVTMSTIRKDGTLGKTIQYKVVREIEEQTIYKIYTQSDNYMLIKSNNPRKQLIIRLNDRFTCTLPLRTFKLIVQRLEKGRDLDKLCVKYGRGWKRKRVKHLKDHLTPEQYNLIKHGKE